MKQTKSTIKKQHREIIKSSGNLDLRGYRTHKKLEGPSKRGAVTPPLTRTLEATLKGAGIERPRHGPRIADPAHTRSEIYR